MALYPYLHIALRGEVNGKTDTIYSYPSEGSNIDPRWNSSTVEPGAAIKRFLNATECYVLQDSRLGHYFSYITRNAIHPERGYVMISVLIENGCALTGRALMSLFTNLSRTLIEEGDFSDDAVDDAIVRSGIHQEPLRSDAWAYQPPSGEKAPGEAAYRTYISQQELESIFSFPWQPEYSDYRCVIVVSAATSLRPGVKMPRITTPIRRIYSVVCPEGVTASSTQLYDGDKLELTYSAPGFDDHKETMIVGSDSPSAYTKYDGSTIYVRTAKQTGIRFERKTPVSVVSAKGTPIQGYTITMNGRSVNTMEPYIVFYEKDLRPGEEVSLVVRSTNFRTLKIKKPTEEMLATDSLKFVMQPDEKGITLRLDFGEGRIFEQQISIEKNTPEYNRLHSGSFHGFRAHRLVTSEDEGEIYNVDLRTPQRSGMGAAAVNQGSASHAYAAVSSKNERHYEPENNSPYKAPHFENVSADARGDGRPKSYGSLPEKEDDAHRDSMPSHAFDSQDHSTASDNDRHAHNSRHDRHDKKSKHHKHDNHDRYHNEDDNDGNNIIEMLEERLRSMTFYRSKGFMLTVIALVVIFIGILLFSGGSSDNETGELLAENDTAVVKNPEMPLTSESAPVNSSDMQADIDYLNSSDVWKLSQLRTQSARDLIKAIGDGDIDAVVNNDYFAVGGRATNVKAIDCADLIWRAKGSYSENANRRIMRQIVKGGNIDLKSFFGELSKHKPSEKFNDSPRPRK